MFEYWAYLLGVQIAFLLTWQTGAQCFTNTISILNCIQFAYFQSQYDDGTDTTRRQLLTTCGSLSAAGESCVEALLDVWRGVVQRVYHYYQLSAKSYFKFLKLNGGVSLY